MGARVLGDPVETIKWVALVPLVGFAATPFLVETRGDADALAIAAPSRSSALDV